MGVWVSRLGAKALEVLEDGATVIQQFTVFKVKFNFNPSRANERTNQRHIPFFNIYYFKCLIWLNSAKY
jgi:hypothetical protein